MLYTEIQQVNQMENELTLNFYGIKIRVIAPMDFILKIRHDFSYLKANAPATLTAAADSYYDDESDFTTFTNLKHITYMQWIKSATGEHGRIDYMPTEEFQEQYPYVEYSGNPAGKASIYTKRGTRYFYNCKWDEAVTVRAFYQMRHGAFANDNALHLFEPDEIGFQAIVCGVLAAVQDVLKGVQISQKGMQMIQQKEYWINELIRHDLVKPGQEIKIKPNHRKIAFVRDEDPYDWA